MSILLAWAELDETSCRHCGRPRAIHEHQSAEDYNTGYDGCPAMEAIDASQARIAEAEDAQALKAGRNPERWRTWYAWTDDEPPPH